MAARIKVEDVVKHLDYQLKRALAEAVTLTVPDAQFSRQQLYKQFVKRVRRRCKVWEDVPAQCVEVD